MGRVQRPGIEAARLHVFPDQRPAQADDRRNLQKGRRHPAVQRGQQRVADQLVVIGQDRGEFVAAPVEVDTEKADERHAADQRLQRGIAAFLDHLDGFGARARGHAALPFAASKVKAPVAVATGRPLSASWAVARTKATERVTL